MVLAAPATADMAAQAYRTGLWEREGFTAWNAQWYGGHHVPGYSLLFPPLAALLGARVVGALAVVAAAWLFAPLARRHAPTPAAASAATWLFAAGAASNVVIGRMPFALGLACAVAAWLAADRDRLAAAAALALACVWSSPVAGLFLALCAAALGPRRRAVALAAPAIAGGLAIALAFPEGGSERFVATAFWPMLGVSLLALAALAPDKPAVRAGAILYVALLVAAFVVPNPLGQNALRLGVIVGPALLALTARRARIALLAGAALLYLQWLPAVRALAEADGDPATAASFHAEARRFLEPRLRPGERVEVVFTKNHWEAAYLAPHVPLARGWERQLDRSYNELFYDGEPLTAARYRAWLEQTGVRFVALPAAPLDFSAHAEARLVRRDPPYLRGVYRSPRWRIWEVANAAPAVAGPGRMVAAEVGAFTVEATADGTLRTRQRHTRYWTVTAGNACVRRGPGGFAEVVARSPGRIAVEAKVRVSAWSTTCNQR